MKRHLGIKVPQTLRYYHRAQIRQGADRVSAPTRRSPLRQAGLVSPELVGRPAANNDNIRGDMPFGERLQRSSQLAVVLLGHRHCQGRAPHSFATTEVRRAPQSRTRLQLEFQRC